jgi:hypothetical protein
MERTFEQAIELETQQLESPLAPEECDGVIESWRMVWRQGFAPLLSTLGLESLRNALKADDLRLTQGSTTTPPPLLCVHDWPVEGACAVGYCGWQGEGLETVGEVEEFFARSCFEADQRLGEPAACRWFLNWFDDTPRDQMRRDLLSEVERSLNQRFDIELDREVEINQQNIAAA